MSKSICLLCHNSECDNSQQFKEDREQCSAFKDRESIDWEQRRYELAKEILVKCIDGTSMSMEEGYINYVTENAFSIATKFIDKCKEKK